MVKTVGSVYQTVDYSIFKKLHGNRDVLESRKMVLVKSIKERGWIRNPIVINENMEIIDGQGRFEALQELGMPVEYVVSRGATIDDCIALNIKQGNWKNTDYVKCYADMGNEHYKLLFSLYGRYKHLSDTCVNTIAGKLVADGTGATSEIKEGKFKIYKRETLYKRLDFADKFMSFIGDGCGRARGWCAVLKFVYECENINCDVLLQRMQKHKALIVPCTTTKQVLDCIEKVYNYGNKNKVYFVLEWDKYIRNKRKGE